MVLHCGEQGCQPFLDLHDDMYKDHGVRDRAMKSVCPRDVYLKPLLTRILGGMILFALCYAGWATVNIVRAKELAEHAKESIKIKDEQYVSRKELSDVLVNMNKNLTDIKTTVNGIESRQDQVIRDNENTRILDLEQGKQIHENRIEIERLK